MQQLGRGASRKSGGFGHSPSDETEVIAQVVYPSVACALSGFLVGLLFSGYFTLAFGVVCALAAGVWLGWVGRRLSE